MAISWEDLIRQTCFVQGQGAVGPYLDNDLPAGDLRERVAGRIVLIIDRHVGRMVRLGHPDGQQKQPVAAPVVESPFCHVQEEIGMFNMRLHAAEQDGVERVIGDLANEWLARGERLNVI
ncbi:MAG: hypothetical protein EXR98_07070 [Gemmataceae bacterium]|nr:hypothetical protein [Gemmataceae bacterium]